MHRGDCSGGGGLGARAASQPLGLAQPSAPGQRDAAPSAPAPREEREPPALGAAPDGEELELELELDGRVCPQCALLQSEIDSLKEQLVFMQSLIDKFQTL